MCPDPNQQSFNHIRKNMHKRFSSQRQTLPRGAYPSLITNKYEQRKGRNRSAEIKIQINNSSPLLVIMEYNPSVPNDFKLWDKKDEINLQVHHEKLLKRVSKAVVLLNMIEEFDEECEDDVRDEAKKHGKVVDFAVFLDDLVYKVQIYVLFDDERTAGMFLKTMDGRLYDGRKIAAYFYSEDDFMKNRLGNLEDIVSSSD